MPRGLSYDLFNLLGLGQQRPGNEYIRGCISTPITLFPGASLPRTSMDARPEIDSEKILPRGTVIPAGASSARPRATFTFY